jgi:radical SAM superfamily enzyme YgiQ (UPF0313 family)
LTRSSFRRNLTGLSPHEGFTGGSVKVLLIRPDPGNDRFGLGPFFRVEPLGLEYVAAALRNIGAEPMIVDERLEWRRTSWITRSRARVVGISCMHALEYDRVLDLASRVRRVLPDAFIVVGGHAAAAYAAPLEAPQVDAICVDDGEEIMPALVRAIAQGRSIDRVPGLRVRTTDGWVDSPTPEHSVALDTIPLPARDLVGRYRRRYHCLLFKPVWLVETARGCPFRCSFCSVWQLYRRSFRDRAIDIVVQDFASVGENVFVVDDLFWHHPQRSLELAEALKKKGIRKRWLLVQSRADLVSRQPELLEAWRPIAQDFDIFLGLESASDAGLERLTKDALVDDSVQAASVARSMRYGVTGNFVIDPDWDEDRFRELWEFVAHHGFQRAGYSILTPLPGTAFHGDVANVVHDQPWFKYDMHHLLWKPRLGERRFFELYAETWRRSILNLKGQKRWRDWVVQVRPAQLPYLARVLRRTQRMMRAEAYLTENRPETLSEFTSRPSETATQSSDRKRA